MYSSALFTNNYYENDVIKKIVRILLSMSLDSILVSSVVSIIWNAVMDKNAVAT